MHALGAAQAGGTANSAPALPSRTAGFATTGRRRDSSVSSMIPCKQWSRESTSTLSTVPHRHMVEPGSQHLTATTRCAESSTTSLYATTVGGPRATGACANFASGLQVT